MGFIATLKPVCPWVCFCYPLEFAIVRFIHDNGKFWCLVEGEEGWGGQVRVPDQFSFLFYTKSYFVITLSVKQYVTPKVKSSGFNILVHFDVTWTCLRTFSTHVVQLWCHRQSCTCLNHRFGNLYQHVCFCRYCITIKVLYKIFIFKWPLQITLMNHLNKTKQNTRTRDF